jgi:hypothetical protein
LLLLEVQAREQNIDLVKRAVDEREWQAAREQEKVESEETGTLVSFPGLARCCHIRTGTGSF